MPRRFRRHREGLADIARAVGWSFGYHRTDRAPQLALLALHARCRPTAGVSGVTALALAAPPLPPAEREGPRAGGEPR